MAQNPRISRFPARGGPVSQNVNCTKIADNHPEQRGNFFSRFGTPSPGKLRFSVFGPDPEFRARSPKWAKPPLHHRFRPVGV